MILRLAAIGEIATGVLMLAVPAAVARLLLGEELGGSALVLARAFGIGIIGLGVACWPGPPRLGMAVYSGGIALFLATMGLAGAAGVLLWPAVALHAALAGMLLLRR